MTKTQWAGIYAGYEDAAV